MPIVPLYGHAALRSRLERARRGGTLPQSLLFHGPVGIGKQRLALWLAQSLVCERPSAPCDECRQCRYVRELTHPDVLWAFPIPRPKDADRDASEVRSDLQVAARERAEADGLYAAPSGSDGIYIATVRAMVSQAALSPALAPRKVFIVGDADRMVPQEGSEFAANAFLKLLEEPPADTTIILTTSAAGSLLPTIRSRVVAVRVAPLRARCRRRVRGQSTGRCMPSHARPPHVEAERVALAVGAPRPVALVGLKRPPRRPALAPCWMLR
ncbi:MAG: hypothetical protein U0163_18645 [Gemmatimonadaceae bacterium]